MTIVTRHYDSVHAALDAIEGSKINGAWRFFSEEHFGTESRRGQDVSLQGTGDRRGETLDTFLQYCRTFSAPYLAERTEKISELSSSLQATGLQAASMKRQQVWSRQGSRINPHRVLRGQLSTAWRKTIREQRSSTMGRIALVLNIAVSCAIDAEQILWSTAATLALADIARNAGRSVDVYGVAYGREVFTTIHAHVLCIPLMLSHEVWSIHNTALSTSPAFFRRLCFRLWEIEQPQYKSVTSYYGFPGTSREIRPWVDSVLAPHIGLPASAIYLGVTQNDHVKNQASARYWLEQQITDLNNA